MFSSVGLSFSLSLHKYSTSFNSPRNFYPCGSTINDETRPRLLIRFPESPVYPEGGSYILHLTPERNSDNPLFTVDFPLPSHYQAVPYLLLLPRETLPDNVVYQSRNPESISTLDNSDNSSPNPSPSPAPEEPSYSSFSKKIIQELQNDLESPLFLDGDIDGLQILLSRVNALWSDLNEMFIREVHKQKLCSPIIECGIQDFSTSDSSSQKPKKRNK